ncbi:MAG TPA: RES domain-containing protein [Candidatus Nitrosotalea sp.]|nr:RES domain-containing protein [Candidatus Nitrosotalea sp.]
MKLFRVFPHDPSAAENEIGGALFVPPPSPLGRISNPPLYRELYFSDSAGGAVGERFGFLPVWRDVDFLHPGGLRYSVTGYELDAGAAIFSLDDVGALVTLGITSPSSVVTRERSVTQDWAKVIFQMGRYAGARWWSYYSPQWTSFGLWDHAGIRHIGPPEPLAITHEAVKLAARTIVRQLY